MKEALMLLLVLLIGLFTSQSFGYSTSYQDTKLLNTIYGKVDFLKLTDPEKLTDIYERFPPVIERFGTTTREHFILNEIYLYIDHILFPDKVQPSTPSDSDYSDSMIEALWEMFQ